MRLLEDLINTAEPGLELVQEWAREGTNPVEFLPRDLESSERALLALQVTTRSPMGALVYETGGLLVDRGWVRVLGGGGERLPALDTWNRCERGPAGHRLPGALIVGWDVLGGFFALNGGSLGEELGQVYYFAQDCLEWESLGRGYSDWLCFLFAGDLDEFYGDQRWPGWEEEISGLARDRGISVQPPLCAQGPRVGERSRAAVPLEEIWSMFVRSEE
jgi:uncharacterized protein DUF2625